MGKLSLVIIKGREYEGIKINEICYCGLLLLQQLGCCLFNRSPVNSETVTQCTDHASFLTLIFDKVV